MSFVGNLLAKENPTLVRKLSRLPDAEEFKEPIPISKSPTLTPIGNSNINRGRSFDVAYKM